MKPSTSIGAPPLARNVAPHDEDVQRALEEILESAQFRASKQSQNFLRYVVVHSLTNRDELLRERVIGAEVFGRSPDYDTGNDPVVRARAAEVRKRLAQYYLSAEHDRIPVRINIPPGSYRASFEWHPSGSDSHSPALVADSAPSELSLHVAVAQTPGGKVRLGTARPRRSAPRWVLLAASLAIVCVLSLLGLRNPRAAQQTALRLFWSPVLNSPKPVLIYTGTNVVYQFRPNFIEQYTQVHHLQTHGEQFALDFEPGQKIDADYLAALTNGFITKQDALAGCALTALLARRGKPYELRYGSDISFGDLRSRPSILIGAFDNRWTLEMTDGLRFVFDGGDRIVDRSGKHSVWLAGSGSDYAVVSRLLNSQKTGGVLITIAGISGNGTQAAADFLTDPQRIASLVRSAPPEWSKKNMQVVLHTNVVEDTPGAPQVVAVHYW